jgi:hypothetical protein
MTRADAVERGDVCVDGGLLVARLLPAPGIGTPGQTPERRRQVDLRGHSALVPTAGARRPRQARVGEGLGCSESGVGRAYNELETRGYTAVKRTDSGTPHRYRILRLGTVAG